jgi:hypothetical protein
VHDLAGFAGRRAHLARRKGSGGGTESARQDRSADHSKRPRAAGRLLESLEPQPESQSLLLKLLIKRDFLSCQLRACPGERLGQLSLCFQLLSQKPHLRVECVVPSVALWTRQGLNPRDHFRMARSLRLHAVVR